MIAITAQIISILVITLISMIIIVYTTRSFIIAVPAATSFVLLASFNPRLQLAILILVAISTIIAIFSAIIIYRGKFGEPLTDILKGPTRWSPTVLALTALILYIIDAIILGRFQCPLRILYYSTSLISSIIGASISTKPYESIGLGLISGLGPVGLTITLAYASFKPLDPPKCNGLDIGELVGFSSFSSVTRALLRTRVGDWRQKIIVCSAYSKAVLELEEPWILWVYGRRSRIVSESIARRLDGALIINLGAPKAAIEDIEDRIRSILEEIRSGNIAEVSVGGLEPVEVRVALTLSIYDYIERLGIENIVIDLEGVNIDTNNIFRLVFEAVRRAKRVIVSLPDIPWTEPRISPRGPAKSSGFIIAGLADPKQADSLANALAPSNAEDLRDIMIKGSTLVGFPGCDNRLIVFNLK
ncbi:MAG: hypothetical protein QXR22_03895 [Acidilobaceae archaeon]